MHYIMQRMLPLPSLRQLFSCSVVLYMVECAMFKSTVLSLAACCTALAAESFEKLPNGKISNDSIQYGTISAEDGHAEIIHGHARTGNKALHLMGGENRRVTINLAHALEVNTPCRFWLERWTRKDPFHFIFSAITPEGEKIFTRKQKWTLAVISAMFR